jgi:hypothetical protein
MTFIENNNQSYEAVADARQRAAALALARAEMEAEAEAEAELAEALAGEAWAFGAAERSMERTPN